jgi:hypothetical protein
MKKKSQSSFEKFNPFVKSQCKNSRELKGEFLELNNKYFEGRLPKDYMVLVCSKSKNFGHRSAGFCSDSAKKIYVRAGMSRNATLQTLVHEMAHVKIRGNRGAVHGRAFLAELARLRSMGAPLSTGDLDVAIPQRNGNFRTRVQIDKARVRELVAEAVNSLHLKTKRSVASFLESELEMPISEIRKIADLELEIQRALL